jgi:hypothetical protein
MPKWPRAVKDSGLDADKLNAIAAASHMDPQIRQKLHDAMSQRPGGVSRAGHLFKGRGRRLFNCPVVQPLTVRKKRRAAD